MRCKKVNYGKLIIILGISAVGKTYFKEYLTEKYDLYKLKKVVTREKRKVEKNNTEINISEKEFKDMIKDDEFFIYTKIYNNYYGYLNSDLKKVEEGAFAIGDCYYKLLSELKRTLKEKLIVIYSYIQTYYIMLFFIASSMNHKIVLCFLPGDISMFNKLVENVRI